MTYEESKQLKIGDRISCDKFSDGHYHTCIVRRIDANGICVDWHESGMRFIDHRDMQKYRLPLPCEYQKDLERWQIAYQEVVSTRYNLDREIFKALHRIEEMDEDDEEKLNNNFDAFDAIRVIAQRRRLACEED